jgi:hypothetical protein
LKDGRWFGASTVQETFTMPAKGSSPYQVETDSSGNVVANLPGAMAESLKPKLAEYGSPCEASEAATGNTTLNFGAKADALALQGLIDSFTIPPIPVIMGA